MTDRREAILARLAAIAGSVPGVTLAARNKLNPTDQQLPAIIIFDADEEADDKDPEQSRPVNAPRRVKLVPQITIQLGTVPDDVGTQLNKMRAALVKAIMTDATLPSLTLDRFGIHYLGCSTELSPARTMVGTMWVHMRFTYPLRPDEL